MPGLWGRDYPRPRLLSFVGHMCQLAEARPIELVDGPERGCRAVTLTNGSGLSLSVLTDRGMSIADLAFRGVPLAYKTPIGAVHPSFCECRGTEWLRSWPGGFCTPCGLTQVGAPCTDGNEELGLHGRVSALPARQVGYGGKWSDDQTYEVWVEGQVRETAVFAENVLLTRRVSTRLGHNAFVIEDMFENEGRDPVPHMFLQHINLGFPLIDENTRVIFPPGSTEPRDDEARSGIDKCCEMPEPQAEFKEQVFYHDLEPDNLGTIHIAVVNQAFDSGAGVGVLIRYQWSEYPNLIQWKMAREGTYVLGIEPANCLVGGRCAERSAGTLQTLAPGQSKQYRLEVEVVGGSALAEAIAELHEIDYTKETKQVAPSRGFPAGT